MLGFPDVRKWKSVLEYSIHLLRLLSVDDCSIRWQETIKGLPSLAVGDCCLSENRKHEWNNLFF